MNRLAIHFRPDDLVRCFGVQTVEVRFQVVFSWVVHVIRIQDIILIKQVRVNKVVDCGIVGSVKYLKLPLEIYVFQKQIRRLALLFELTGDFQLHQAVVADQVRLLIQLEGFYKIYSTAMDFKIKKILFKLEFSPTYTNFRANSFDEIVNG